MIMKTNKYYAVKNKCDDERINSSSGGVFLALAKNILSKNGVVYGAIYKSDLSVIHTRGESIEDVMKMTGSKYSQSDLTNVIKEIKTDLENGRYVLFTGTPCQVNTIKMYTKDDNNSRLITVDLICHGTPEKKYLKDYITTIEENNKSIVKNINMRYKDKKTYIKNLNKKHTPIGSVAPHYMKLDLSNGRKIIERADFNSYYLMFDYFISPGCFKCPFSKLERISDITLGDFHEFNSKLGNFNDGNGVSLVIVNTKKGNIFIDEEKNNLIIIKKEEKECLQPALVGVASKPEKYDEFKIDYERYGFKYVSKKYSQSGIKYFIKKILHKIGLLDFILKVKNK